MNSKIIGKITPSLFRILFFALVAPVLCRTDAQAGGMCNKQTKHMMYIVFCGLGFGGKKQYQNLAVKHMMLKGYAQNDILIVSDPTSGKFGKKIVQLDRKEDEHDDRESGVVYIDASYNVYRLYIKDALEAKKPVVCQGCFTEVLGYQGSVLGNQGLDWEEIKTVYFRILGKKRRGTDPVKYPSMIFFCIDSFEGAQAEAKCARSESWEAKLSPEVYERYSSQMQEAFKIISTDVEFARHTKLFLVDRTGKETDYVWASQIKPEIDKLFCAYPQ